MTRVLMHIDALLTPNPVDLLYAHARVDSGYNTPLCTVALHTDAPTELDGDVVVRSANAPPHTLVRRDAWIDVVVVSWVPFADGERTAQWLDFYTNCYAAAMIIVDRVCAATMIAAGLEYLQHKFVYMDNTAPLGARAEQAMHRNTAIALYTAVGVAVSGGRTEQLALNALQHALRHGSPARALETPTVGVTNYPTVAFVFDTLGGPLLQHLMRHFTFVVIPHAASAQLSGYDCRQLHRNLDSVLHIARTAEGTAVNQYARELCNVLIDEVGHVVSSFNMLPLKRLTSNWTLFDVIFHAINARGMR